MAKKIEKVAKIQCIGGEAKPGAELASLGINMQKFCQEFNARTQERKAEVVPVVISIFIDKSFQFVLKTSPAAILLKQKLKLEKGSANPKEIKVGVVSQAILEEIAKYKLPDLNTTDLQQAVKIIAGTARSLGLTIGGEVIEKLKKAKSEVINISDNEKSGVVQSDNLNVDLK